MKNSKAYTLVEMSIVLVIIGLLVGSVLSGRELIHGAEMRRMVDFSDQFRSSWFLFKDHYGAAPGDLPTATKFWGTASSGSSYYTVTSVGVTCGSAPTVPTGGTCNGNGDGYIGFYSGERLLMWEHLKLAGIIDYPVNDQTAYYTQAAGLTKGVYAMVANNDSPPLGSQLNPDGTGYTNLIYSMDLWNNGMPDGVPGRGTGLTLAAMGDQYSDIIGGIISPIDMWNLDMKTDDGLPDHGKTMASNGTIGTSGVFYTTCIANPSAGVYKYNVTVTDKACRTKFVLEQR